MKKQITYNFSKLLGNDTDKPLENHDPAGRRSKEKVDSTNPPKSSRRILRPTGIIRLKRSEASNSRSSLRSASSKENTRPTLQSSKNAPLLKNELDNAEEFF